MSVTSVIDVNRVSLSDAEIAEDVSEDFVGGDFAYDGAEVVEGFANVLGNEVGRGGAVKRFADTVKCGVSGFECFEVAYV